MTKMLRRTVKAAEQEAVQKYLEKHGPSGICLSTNRPCQCPGHWGKKSNPGRPESDASEPLSPFALPRKPASQITGWDVPMGMDPDDLALGQ